MLKFSYTYCDAIDKLTSKCLLKLQDYELTEPEWVIVKQLRDCLWVHLLNKSTTGQWPLFSNKSFQIFKTVTLEFSSDMPCLATVIPAINRMYDELTMQARNVTYSPALHTVLTLRQKLLNKYYSLMDDAEVYWIAIGKFFLS